MTTNLKIGDLFRQTNNPPWYDVCKVTGFNDSHVWGAWGIGAMHCAPMMVTMDEFERLIETGEWQDANKERAKEVHDTGDEA